MLSQMKTLLSFLILSVVALQLMGQSNTPEKAMELAERGKFKQALTTIDDVISNNYPMAGYFHSKANYLMELGELEKALQSLSDAIILMPDSISLYDFRGALLETARMYKEAIQDFSTGCEKAKTDELRSHFLANRGGTKYRIRDFQGAYTDLMASIELDYTNIDALNNLAAVCDHVNQPHATLKYLEQIIAIDSTYAPAYINLGFKYQELNQHAKAIAYFNKVASLTPNEPLAYSNRSFSKLKTNDLEGANKDISRAIKLAPTNSYAFKIKALINIEKKKFKLACNDLHTAKELGYTLQFGDEVEELLMIHCK